MTKQRTRTAAVLPPQHEPHWKPRTICPTCGDYGSNPCPHCDGDGCDECYDTGEIDCEACS